MRKIFTLLLAALVLLSAVGCTAPDETIDILTTTAPLYTFTSQLCAGTELVVHCMITESVSCLHDYTLQTSQMRVIEGANLLILSGAGLEDSFIDTIPSEGKIVDASVGVELHCGEHKHEDHENEHNHSHDPHIWLAPQNAMQMVSNITLGLIGEYPQYEAVFEKNRLELLSKLEELDAYGKQQLSGIASKELITFHDGFAYLADAFALHILHAIEEESGSEASASEIIFLCNLVRENKLPAVFIEKNGSVSAAEIISAETGVKIYSLDMAMSGDYFSAMYHNINTLKEALG